jgi:autotransporter-associated beta strand protein
VGGVSSDHWLGMALGSVVDGVGCESDLSFFIQNNGPGNMSSYVVYTNWWEVASGALPFALTGVRYRVQVQVDETVVPALATLWISATNGESLPLPVVLASRVPLPSLSDSPRRLLELHAHLGLPGVLPDNAYQDDVVDDLQVEVLAHSLVNRAQAAWQGTELNPDNDQASVTNTVIASPPVANFVGNPTYGLVPLTVTFTDLSSGGIANRFWSFGDGATTDTFAQTVQYTYTALGPNTVRLIVTGPLGASTNIQPNYISVLTPYENWQQQHFGCTGCPQAAEGADPDTDGQDNFTEFLAGTDPTSGVSYWHIQANPTNGLQPLAISFSQNSTGSSITNQLWTFGDGTTSSAPNPIHTYSISGTFSVDLTIFNLYGTATLSVPSMISVSSVAIWTNANVSDVWSKAGSWDPMSVPDHGSSVIFANAGATAVVDNVSRSVSNITFDAPNDFTIAAAGDAGLTINNLIVLATNTYTISAPVMLAGNAVWSVISNGALQVFGSINGTNSITKIGAGSLTLSGTNTYSGPTIISNGTLHIIGHGVITNTVSIDVAKDSTLDVAGRANSCLALVSGQILTGEGVICGNLILSDGSTLSPGSSVGVLRFLNDLAVSNNAVLHYELGSNSDLVVVSGNLTLGGRLDIDDAGELTNGVYTLATYGGTLTDNGVTIGAIPTTNFVYIIDTSTVGQVKLIVTLPPSIVEVDAANLQDGSGNLAPTSTVVVLVADMAHNGFTDPAASFLLSVGARWGSDDKVVALWDLRDEPGLLCGQVVVPYVDGIAAGQKLQLYWFPSLTSASNTVGFTAYGKYTDTNSPPLDGSAPWEIPAPNSEVVLGFFTDLVGGSNPETAGQATLLSGTKYEHWQIQYFGCTDCPQAADSADPDGDGQVNFAEFLAGTDPLSATSAFRILALSSEGDNMRITWATAGGRTNAVQAAINVADGCYTTNFIDVTGPIIIPGNGEATTNYIDEGGATNAPARFYRIRLVP